MSHSRFSIACGSQGHRSRSIRPMTSTRRKGSIPARSPRNSAISTKEYVEADRGSGARGRPEPRRRVRLPLRQACARAGNAWIRRKTGGGGENSVPPIENGSGVSDERAAAVLAWLHAEGKIDALRKVGALVRRCATASVHSGEWRRSVGGQAKKWRSDRSWAN